MTEFANIPTTYAGVRFRSRLEAKWACFFDQLKWTWDYEPLDLNGWIPDFVAEHPKYNTKPLLIEVKPVKSDRDPELDVHFCKIETALGIPRKNDPRLAAAFGKELCEVSDWDNCPDIEYKPVLLGAYPMVLGVHIWRNGGYGPGAYGRMGLGWDWAKNMGWWTNFHWEEPARIKEAWNHAANLLQWKRPA